MSSLTIDHLLWRMKHVHTESELVSVHGSSGDLRVEHHSYPDIADRVWALAKALQHGFQIGPNSTIAVLAFNTLEHFELLLAAPVLGASLNSLNARLSPEHLREQALYPRPAAVLVDAEIVAHPDLGANARTLLEVFDDQGIPLITVGELDLTSQKEKPSCYDDLFEIGAEVGLRDSAGEDAVAYHFHTSGTTGPPKTFEVTQRQAMLHALSQATADAAGLRSTDRVLSLAPFFHVNGWGLPLTSALTGASLVVPGGDLAADRVAEILASEKVTIAAAVPTVWHDVCASVNAGLGPAPKHLREVLSGGSSVPESVIRQVRKVLGAEVVTAWGMTETMACSTYERASPSTAAGKPIPLVEIRIEDAVEGSAAPPQEIGRLQVRGPFVVGLDSASAWFETGDIASVDHDGRMTLHDREKDLIKSGGEWIASAELEQHICTHPGVHSAAVVPISDPRWIERPIAYVIMGDKNYSTDEIAAALSNHIADKFPRWWVPDQFVIVSELPRTAVGKIDKRKLRSYSLKTPNLQSEATA